MITLLLILLPLLTGVLCFASKDAAKPMALAGALATLGIALWAILAVRNGQSIDFSAPWIPMLGATVALHADSTSIILTLLTAIVMLTVFIAQWNKDVERPHAFYGLMMLSAAGLMGVFLAYDALLFYMFWELALIPVYFLCSQWGGEKRIAVTFKFFVYTFVGSLLMLAGLIYLSQKAGGNFSWNAITEAGALLGSKEQSGLFVLLFIAFAIKMPIFPFHTWQPDTYEQSPTPVTIVLSALMVKMGLFAAMRWLLPTVPMGVAYWSDAVTMLCIIGIIYASVIALTQTNLKRLIAYSSIAHMGLMATALFSGTAPSMQGLQIQMFTHGVIITGLWLLVSFIENRYGTRNLNELGGMATTMPKMAIALVLLSFANVALPLTAGFTGEFMLFHGLFQSTSSYRVWFMVLAGLGIILGAAYTLRMVQKVAWGEPKTASIPGEISMQDLTFNEWLGLALMIGLVLFFGFYPQPLLNLAALIS
ncbi:MAG: NADH-quinone oxidoreductase subunit M [Sphingobacteriales bacterium]|nr:MAG: NADH-quinone oxidoreductase subunit M [Sphingobacteriales bacterium]